MSGDRNYFSDQFRTGFTARFACALCVVGATFGCQQKASPHRVSAEFGVLFGGQVQKLAEIPFELDATRQRTGFRLVRTGSELQQQRVQWELAMARTGRRLADSQGRKGRRHIVRFGSQMWRAGETQFDQLLPFEPKDPLGMWNIRILLDGEAVLDRPFTVYSARTRARRPPASR